MPSTDAIPADEVFVAYPELRARIDSLCERLPWCITGVSALLCDDHHLYLEIVKRCHWAERPDGATVVGLGAVGGSLNPDEALLDGLAREVREEVGCAAHLASSPLTHLVSEGRPGPPLALPPRDYPRPVLLTISRNVHRRRALAPWPTLAIVTFWAGPVGALGLGDIHGLLAIPHEVVARLLAKDEITVAEALCLPGIRLMVRHPLPEHAVLTPVWTVRSLHELSRAGALESLGWTGDVEPA